MLSTDVHVPGAGATEPQGTSRSESQPSTSEESSPPPLQVNSMTHCYTALMHAAPLYL